MPILKIVTTKPYERKFTVQDFKHIKPVKSVNRLTLPISNKFFNLIFNFL